MKMEYSEADTERQTKERLARLVRPGVDPKPRLGCEDMVQVSERVTEGLLPCPFCGSTETFAEGGYDDEADWCGAAAGCAAPGCGAKVESVEVEYAIEKWNRRTPREGNE